MILAWAPSAWDDYLYWQATDRKVVKRINSLIEDVKRHPFTGLGDPEPLRHNWSRRIDREHRLVYKADASAITIAQCRYHY